MRYLFLMIFAYIFNGCSIYISYIDASNEEKYSMIVGKTFKTVRAPTRITANLINDDDKFRAKKLSSYTITEIGYAGRWVLWSKEIPYGTLIAIDKALKYDSVIIDDFALKVSFKNLTFKLEDNLPIRLRSDLTKTTKDGKYIIMNPKYFQEVKLDK